MNTQPENTYTITFHRTRDHTLKLRGGARLEPTTPSGQRRIWQPPPPDDNKATMNSPLKDPYTITFHRTRDHTLKLRGGARREPTTTSGKRRIWQPPQPDDGQSSEKTQDQ